MFRQMKNIDTAFRHIKVFSIAFLLGNVITVCFSIYKYYQQRKEDGQKIYILAGGKTMSAFASERTENLEIEAKDHIKTFHELFFTLDPDEKVIRKNISKALYLADATAKQEYDNLQENGYYAGIISGNISQTINVDSVLVNTSTLPYLFRCYATQEITRTTSKVRRNLITEGALREVSRSDNNSHGFLIERWSTLENRDINTEAR